MDPEHDGEDAGRHHLTKDYKNLQSFEMHGQVARIQLGLLDAYEFQNWSTSNKAEDSTSSLLSSYRQWAAVTANRLPICGILLLILHIIV